LNVDASRVQEVVVLNDVLAIFMYEPHRRNRILNMNTGESAVSTVPSDVSLSLSDDANHIVWFKDDHAVVTDLRTGKAMRVTVAEGRPNVMALSPDGKRLATFGAEQDCIYDLTTRRGRSLDLPHLANTAKFSPDGDYLVVGCDEGVYLQDLRDPASVAIRLHHNVHPLATSSIAFSPDGRTLSVGQDDGTLLHFDFTPDRRGAPRPPQSPPAQ
jgi:WD40 repeat protein